MDLGDANLIPIRVLGEGSFGRVFHCYRTKQGQTRNDEVCVKRIIVRNPRIEIKMILEEVYIISQLKHPNIVQFIRSYVHASTVNIVMEYLPGGTLRDVIKRASRIAIPKKSLLRYFCDILMGLEYLHIRNVIHRDLKPENLLLDNERHVKIADFGIAAVHQPFKTTWNTFGTPYYLAPELMQGQKADFKTDIWSFGIVLYEMCIASKPFEGDAKNLDELRHLVRRLTQPKLNCKAIADNYGAHWAKLCEEMLVYNPEKRITLSGILRSHACITIPYYQKYFDYKY